MKTCYDNMMKEENTAMRVPSFKIGDGDLKLGARMPDDKALGEWNYTLSRI